MKTLSFFLIALFAMACSHAPKIFTSETTPSVNFSQYKTYAFIPTTDTGFTKLINRKAFERELAIAGREQLKSRGMILDTIHPDCLFQYTLIMKKDYALEQQQHVDYNPRVYNTVAYNGDPIYYFSSDNKPAVYGGKTTLQTFRDGSFVIDMIDTKTKQVLWRSSAVAKRDEKNLPPMKETIDYVVPQMFKSFPKK
ncbi:MAG: DUF4136 domain-containing protein [Filimonas sp.]|nr:DUF4136 domain-containing protein [Filimonas sp.]